MSLQRPASRAPIVTAMADERFADRIAVLVNQLEHDVGGCGVVHTGIVSAERGGRKDVPDHP